MFTIMKDAFEKVLPNSINYLRCTEFRAAASETTGQPKKDVDMNGPFMVSRKDLAGTKKKITAPELAA